MVLSKEILQEIVPSVIDIGVDEFLKFASKYKDAAKAYKDKHFEDRAFFKRYTETMVESCLFLIKNFRLQLPIIWICVTPQRINLKETYV